MNLIVQRTIKFGLEWQVVLPDQPDRSRFSHSEYELPDDPFGDECPTQEAVILPDLKPRKVVVRR
ncbi:MAG: hypothetical protein IPM16_14690 [Chloroflexi bacterium]|nr:hypothetical protein [Chloroflexota bacterium]